MAVYNTPTLWSSDIAVYNTPPIWSSDIAVYNTPPIWSSDIAVYNTPPIWSSDIAFLIQCGRGEVDPRSSCVSDLEMAFHEPPERRLVLRCQCKTDLPAVIMS